MTDVTPMSGSSDIKFSMKPKRKKVVKRILLAIVLLSVLAGAALGIYLLFFKAEARVALTDSTIYGSLDRSIEGSGTTVPAESLSITAASNAEIEEVLVKVGDIVAVGDLLYTQDDSEVDEKISDYNEQIADYEDEISDYQNDIIDQNSGISDYYEKINDYRSEIAEVRETMEKLSVRAPFSGKIESVSAAEGKSVNSGTALAVITDDSVLEFKQYISRSYLDKVYVGMPANVTVTGRLGELEGRVSEINNIEWLSSEGMRCFEVTVELSNPGALTKGQSAASVLKAFDGTMVYPVTSGELAYKNTETITSEVSGKLLSVDVSAYSTVYAGQVLFTIDGESYEDQIENLQKQITSTNKQITSAQTQIENIEKKIANVEEKIADLYEDIEEAEESREDYRMTSDISGKVMYVNIEPGDRPNTMMSVITIYNLDTMTLSVNFDELDVDYISEGTAVTITRTSAERNTYYDGVITYLSPEASSSNGVATFAATIEIASNGALSSGVSVSYRIALGDSEEGVLAPISALKSHEDKYYLYVKSDTRPANAVELIEPATEVPEGFYAVPVEVGSSNSQYIRIVSGVDADVEVFTRYRQNAPTGGNSTSAGMEDDEMNFEDMFGSGGMPGGFGGGGSGGGFGGGGGGSSGGMPSFGGSGGGGGGGMPGGR